MFLRSGVRSTSCLIRKVISDAISCNCAACFALLLLLKYWICKWVIIWRAILFREVAVYSYLSRIDEDDAFDCWVTQEEGGRRIVMRVSMRGDLV